MDAYLEDDFQSPDPEEGCGDGSDAGGLGSPNYDDRRTHCPIHQRAYWLEDGCGECGSPKEEIAWIPVRKAREIVNYAIVDARDYDRLARFSWSLHQHGYARNHHGYMHRMVLEMGKGEGGLVDHINGNPLDNRRSNLRRSTYAENNQNRRGVRRDATSRFLGVSWNDDIKKWAATVGRDYETVHLGHFEREADARECVRAWRAEHMPFSVEAADALREERDALRARVTELEAELNELKEGARV